MILPPTISIKLLESKAKLLFKNIISAVSFSDSVDPSILLGDKLKIIKIDHKYLGET